MTQKPTVVYLVLTQPDSKDNCEFVVCNRGKIGRQSGVPGVVMFVNKGNLQEHIHWRGRRRPSDRRLRVVKFADMPGRTREQAIIECAGMVS